MRGKSSTQNTLKFVLDLLSLIPPAPRALDAQTLTKQLALCVLPEGAHLVDQRNAAGTGHRQRSQAVQ